MLRKNIGIKLLFVGGGTFKERKVNLLDSLGLLDSVVQMNASDAELAYIYQHAICFIYPSYYEGFGFLILEAFDNLCPVICNSSSSLPEVGGDAALYYEKEDSKKLLEFIELMMYDYEKKTKCITKGKNRVRIFTWEKCAYETYQVYQKLIESFLYTLNRSRD